MASENEASCESDPNFAVICCFLEKFGETCGLSNIDFLDLQEMLENTQEVPQDLVELHIKLLRKAKKSVSNERWERALIKVCHSYCSQDAWELERFGYKKSRISVKLRTLKHLLEMQFDLNQKFKNDVNKMSAEQLRTQPLGRDRLGNAYWCQCDEACQIRVYKEDPDEETWTLVARSREGLVSLISQLNSGDSAKSSSEPVSNEDSNSVEVEKPILDTGQAQDSSNSSEMSAKQLSEDNVEANDHEDLEVSNQISDENVEEVEECDTQEKLRPDEEIPEEKDGNESVKVKPKESLDSEQKPDLEDKSDDANETSGEAIEEADEESNDMSEDSKSSDQSTVNNNASEVTNNALNLSSKNDDSLNLALNYKKNNDTQFEYDSESKTGLDLSFKPKPTLRLKPLQELLVQSKLSSHEPDKREFIGIKGKYIRGDPSGEKISLSFASHSSSSLHRKAVQSATFDAISYKRSIEEDDYEEQPMKRSRFDRPTLLGNKKFVPVYDEGEVEDEIEEPLMLVHGESSGYENECNNTREEESPVIGEEIEEPTFYVFGEGNGVDCQTGNENLKESDMPQSTNSDKAELNLNLNKDLPGSSGSVLESKCSLMSASKLQYKLGTIIDTKTDKSIARTPIKKSRWDIVSDENLKLNDAAAKVSESERVVEVTTGKVKELVDKFENLSESLVNVKTNTLTDNNSTELSNSAISDNQDQSDKSTVKKPMFFFGNSSNAPMGPNIQSASLNFGASNFSNSLKTSSSDTSNISDTENSQEKSFTPVNINKVPEKLNETASKSALQMSNSADLRDSNIENTDADDDDKTNCDSVLEGGVDKNSEISECDLSSVSSVNTNDTDNNSCKKTEDEPDLAGNDDQANKLNDEVATTITDANLENNTDSKNQTVTEIAVENSTGRVFSNSQANVYENKTDEISSSAVSKSETIKGLTESRDSQNPECENEILKDTPLSEEDNILSDTEVSESVKRSPPDDILRSNHKLLTAAPVNEADCQEILDSNSNDVFKMKSPIDTTNNTGAPPPENIEANLIVSDTTTPPSEDIETVKLNEAEKLDLDANNQSESSANINANDTRVLSNDIAGKTIVTMTSCEENTRSSESDQSETCADVDNSISQEEASSENEIKDSSEEREEQINIIPHLELGKEKNISAEKDESQSEDDEKISKNGASQESDASLTTSEVLQPEIDAHDPQSSVGEKNNENKENTTALTSVKDDSDSVTEQVDNKGVGNAESTKKTLDAPDCKQTQEKRNSLETSNEEKTQQNFDVQENLTNKIAIDDKPIVESASNVSKEALIETEESLQSEPNNVEQGLQNETDLSDELKVKNSRSNNEELHSVLAEAENETQGNSAVDEVNELNQGKKISENMKTNSFEKVTVESTVKKESDNKVSNNSVQYSEVKESQIDLNLNTTLDETKKSLSDKETEGKVVCKEGMKNTSEENANCKETLENKEDKDAVENIKDADLKENENEKQVTGNNETDVLNRSSNNLLQEVDPSPKLDINEEIVPATNPISLQENPTQGQEALPKVGKKRGRKPKHLCLEKREFKEFREKRELRSKLKADQQNAEAEKEKSDAGGSGAALNKKFEVVKGIDDQSKKKSKRGRKPLNLKIKRIAVAIVPKIKAKKLTSPSSQKAVVKKVETKGQGAREKVGRPRKSSTEKSAGDASPEKKNKLKPGVITKVMKKTPKSPINVKLGRRRRNKELVEKTEEVVVKKRGPKKKNIELPKEVEMGSITKRTELVVKLKRAELTKHVVAELRNNAENSESLNLMVSLERCEVPMTAAQLHNKERMMSLRKRKPKPLGVIKPKKNKELLKKKTEELGIVNSKSEFENVKMKQETNLPGYSLDTFEENKQDLILHNKTDNADNSKCQKPCKSIVGMPRRRSSRRKTITDAEAESNIDNSTREFEISSKQNECEVDKHENENLNDVNVRKTAACEQSNFPVESEGHLNRFRLSNNDADTSGTINIPPKEEMNEDEGEDDSLDINTAEGETEKITEADDMETIDLTSESEGVPSSAAKNLYQEKLTDCKQGVMIKGVLIKGDVTIKVKERIPVEEPLCVKKNVPLLTCIDIEKLKEPDSKCFPGFDVSSPPMSEESFGGGNSDVVIIEDDPLADIAPMESAPAPFTLSTFKLDSTEPLTTVVSTRSLRKRTRCEVPEQIMEENYGKKRKRKGKRLLDLELRKSIEEQKRLEVSSSSSEEDTAREPKKKEPFFKSKNRKSTSTDDAAYVNLESPDAITLDSPTTILVDSPTASSDATVKRESPIIIKKRSPPKKRKKTLLGLDIPSASLIALQNDIECNTVRQSRRIAQLKIREEAERRKLEEMAMSEVRVEKKHKSKKNEDKDYKVEKKKKNKNLIIEEDIAVDVPEVEEKKKKRKRKHKDPRKIFDESNPWRSSSDSSTSNEEDEEEEIVDYSEAESPLFKSDHEFSPESDLEESGDVQPLKRARTARKEDDVEEDLDDHACQKCGKQDHPEWILLCDKCDNGWHCSCLRPALLIIPEGDWFCPPCQHLTLITKLEKRLVDYDKQLAKRNIEVRRKQRLAYVGITLANVLPVKEPNKQKRVKKTRIDEDESESEETESETESSSDSESDEPIYQLRQRRQAHSYRFNDYDELINSAIQDEVEAKGIGNQGRGKDIATIVQAEKEEAAQNQEKEVESLPPVVPTDGKNLAHNLLSEQQDNDSDAEKIKSAKKFVGRKKPRKLNCLDVSSGDDPYSDEDFKGSSSAEEEDEFDDELGSDSSEEYGRRRGSVRRSTRARTSRYDKEFINDDTDDDLPKRKRIKSIWDDSESEESDVSWKSRRKRKGVSKRQLPLYKKKSSKKSKKFLDSDSDAYKKKKPRIKYGGLDDDEDVGRRTRGKRINYIDALASDSEDEVKKRGPPKIESDEEYDANAEQDADEEDEDKDSDENENRTAQNQAIPQASSVPNLPDPETTADAKIQDEIATATVPEPVQKLLPEEGKGMFEDHENEDEESELNPIDEINKNLEQMNEKEMEMLMEEEEYANKQLQLMAMQLEREKKRKEREANKKLEKVDVQETKAPKKRGRKPKGSELNNAAAAPMATLQVGPDTQNNSELSEPPGVTIPLFSDSSITTPESALKKRRGRGKGKKTLEKEQAAAAAAAASSSSTGCLATTATTTATYSASSSNSDHIPTTIDSIPSSSNSPSSNTSMHAAQLAIASAPQPFSQSQPTPSVITRMLQSQPTQGNFHMAAGMGGHKYYSGEPQAPPHSDSTSTTVPPTQGQYMHSGPRVLATSYRQPLQNMNSYPITRGSPAPAHRLRAPAPQGIPSMYHSHHPLDPSPSGGGPINVPVGPMNMTTAPPGPLSAPTERNSPGVAPPTSDSPLSNKSDQTPPPPPYTRPQMSRFPQGNSSPLMSPSSARHPHLITPQHVQQPRTNMPYHPGMPPNYYSSYMHPNMATEESLPPPSYQYSEQFSEGSSPQDNCKSYEEENSGEFGGLVSYFSSQREDDLDT